MCDSLWSRQVYFSKTRDILSALRSAGETVSQDHKKNMSLQASLIGEMMGKQRLSQPKS